MRELCSHALTKGGAPLWKPKTQKKENGRIEDVPFSRLLSQRVVKYSMSG